MPAVPLSQYAVHLRPDDNIAVARKPIPADAALTFGWDLLGQRDFRHIRGHLIGRNRLLDGSYQMDELEMRRLAAEEEAMVQNGQ